MSTINQFWWLNAKWPLMSNSDITANHFEDIRRKLHIVFKYYTGHVPPIWCGNAEEGIYETPILGEPGVDSAISAEDYKKGFLVIRTSRTKLWTSGEEIKLGCWRTYEHLDGDVYEALCDMGGEDDIDNNITNPTSSSNWRKITNPPIIEYINSSAKNFYGVTEFDDTFEMPDLHPAAGVWMGGSGIFESGGWAIRVDDNLYHSFDANSLAKRIEALKGQDDIWYYLDVYGYQNLCRQVISAENCRPAVYQGDKSEDFPDRAYRFRHTPEKVSWKKTQVTEPELLGPLYHKNEVNPTKNTYWVDGNWVGNAVNDTEWFNKKISDSFQSCIETAMSNDKFCWPVASEEGQEYIDNWNLVYPDNQWDLNKSECNPYPKLSEEFWGCNGSPFEFILKKLGDDYYDWYFDTSYTYTPDSIRLLSENMEVLTGTPVGTWRRTWKYSMGRASDLSMRSSEMGTPTNTGEAYRIWDGVDSETIQELHWCGIHTATEPATTDYYTESIDAAYVSEFTFSYNRNDATFKRGMMVTVISGTSSIAGWVVDIYESSGYSNHAIISESMAGFGSSLTIKFNPDITTRHDPIHIACDTSGNCYPKYKCDYHMLNHAMEVMDDIYVRCRVNHTSKHLSLYSDPEEIGELGKYLEAQQEREQEVNDGFDASPPNGGGLYTWSNGWQYNVGTSVDRGEQDITYDEFDNIVYSHSLTSFFEDRNAVKFSEKSGYEDDWDLFNFMQNSSSISIRVQYEDLQKRPNGTSFLFNGRDENGDLNEHIEPNQPADINGIHINLIEYTGVGVAKYGSLGLSPDSDGWCQVKCSHCVPIQSKPYYDDFQNPVSIPYEWEFGGANGTLMSIVDDYVSLKLDFNKIPKTVFINENGRDRIGAIEPVGNPEPDIIPPTPNPSVINEKPELQWIYDDANEVYELFIKVVASPAEDLEGSLPVWYKAIINPVDEEEVPAGNWGTSEICLIKLLEVDASDTQGIKYTYNATPADVYDGESIIAHRFTIYHGGTIHVGDKLYFKYPPDEPIHSDFEVTVMAADTSSFDIAATTAASSWDVDIWDISGYNESDWLLEDLANCTVGVKTKDNVGNETKPSEGLPIIYDIENWPIDLYIDREFAGNRNWYLSQLAD